MDRHVNRSLNARIAIVVAVVCLALHPIPASAAAQNGASPRVLQTSAPPGRADEIRRRIEKIGAGNKITIIRFDGIEHYGTIRSIGPNEVEVAEVDIKQAVVDSFVDIKKVRKGYGGINWVSGKRPNPVWGIVAGVAIFVPLLIALRGLD